MNLILFEPHELARPLSLADPRAQHVRRVLRRANGESFDCGLSDGPRGRATIEQEDQDGLHLRFAWDETPPPLDAIWLLLGLPRPQTARKILGEAAALGIAGLIFFGAEKSEASYASSRLWTSGESRRLLLAGVAQAFCTRIPRCVVKTDLAAALAAVETPATRLALDNYEATVPLTKVEVAGLPGALAIGPERGWSSRERILLREAGYTLAHLGPRVLRTETACVAGLTLLKARLELL